MTHSIAAAAERSGLSIDTLRYYERIGLVDPPERDSGGRRVYQEQDLRWIEFLTKLKTTGMSLATMRRYADFRRQGVVTASLRKEILLEQRQIVRARIDELRECQKMLDYKIENYESIESGMRPDSVSSIS